MKTRRVRDDKNYKQDNFSPNMKIMSKLFNEMLQREMQDNIFCSALQLGSGSESDREEKEKEIHIFEVESISINYI